MQFSEALAFELKPFGVYVTVVCPGATQSEFQTNAQMNNMDRMFNTAPLSFMVAEFAYEAMVKKKTTAIHGSVNAFMAFMLRFTPRKLIVSAAAKMMKA